MTVEVTDAFIGARIDPDSIDPGTIEALPSPKRRLRAQLYVTHGVVDAIAVAAGFLLANLIRFGDIMNPQGWTLIAVVLPLFIGFSFSSRVFTAESLLRWRRGVPAVVCALYAAVMVVLFVGFYLRASAEMSRVMLAIGLVNATGLLILGRFLVGRHAARVCDGAPMSRVLIVDGLGINCPPGVRRIDAAPHGLKADVVNPIMLDKLGRLLVDADGVIVASAPARRAAWAMALRGVNIHGEILVPELDSIGGIGATRFAGQPTMLVSAGPLGVRDQMVKRALDLAIGIPVLAFVAPLMLLVALAVRLDSPGPVFFKQQRLGYGNRLFMVFKFRSMRADLCDSAGTQSTRRDDNRVTRVGRFIRATSLDELPQLLNILRGEMSFVGPRPHALGSLAGDQLFWEVDTTYWHRHACKPGLTGLAQIRGFRGATHRREDLINRLRADLEYVNGWSVWRDLSILISTVKVVMHRNAF